MKLNLIKNSGVYFGAKYMHQFYKECKSIKECVNSFIKTSFALEQSDVYVMNDIKTFDFEETKELNERLADDWNTPTLQFLNISLNEIFLNESMSDEKNDAACYTTASGANQALIVKLENKFLAVWRTESENDISETSSLKSALLADFKYNFSFSRIEKKETKKTCSFETEKNKEIVRKYNDNYNVAFPFDYITYYLIPKKILNIENLMLNEIECITYSRNAKIPKTELEKQLFHKFKKETENFKKEWNIEGFCYNYSDGLPCINERINFKKEKKASINYLLKDYNPEIFRFYDTNSEYAVCSQFSENAQREMLKNKNLNIFKTDIEKYKLKTFNDKVVYTDNIFDKESVLIAIFEKYISIKKIYFLNKEITNLKLTTKYYDEINII